MYSDDNNLCETKPRFKLEPCKGFSDSFNLYVLDTMGCTNYRLVYTGSPLECQAWIKMYEDPNVKVTI